MRPDSNPPKSPFDKGGFVTNSSEKPLFEKEGQGEIYSADF
jgi:hypothetical protein